MKNEELPNALIITVEANALPDETYENYDLATLEDQLEEAMTPELGEYDGHEMAMEESAFRLFFYGPDPGKILEAVRSIVVSYPLCPKATAELRVDGTSRQVELHHFGPT